jgi:hypothetical protein
LDAWETQLPFLHYAEQFNSQTSLGSGPPLQIQKLINVLVVDGWQGLGDFCLVFFSPWVSE